VCGGGDFGVSANEYSCALGAQIKFGDLTPYLTYDWLATKQKLPIRLRKKKKFSLIHPNVLPLSLLKRAYKILLLNNHVKKILVISKCPHSSSKKFPFF
jgi:hypothetical protein